MKKKLLLFFTMLMLFSLTMGLGSMAAFAAGSSVTEVSGEITWTTDGNGYLYGTAADGTQLVGWVTAANGDTYYFARSTDSAPLGSAAVGLTQIDGYRYYFNTDGVMQTGWQTVGEDTYYFIPSSSSLPSGSAVTGLAKISGSRYYFSSAGVMQTGWQTIGKYKYYFKSGTVVDGVTTSPALTGLKKVGSYKYYFDSNGRAQKGWVTISKKKYYFASNYRLKTSCWFKVGKYYYYANKNGVMQTSCVTGSSSKGYGYVDSKGHRTTKTDKKAAAMVKKAQSYKSSTKYLILVNSSTNKVGIFTGKKGNWTLKYYWTCSTGKASSPTVKGSYTVGSRGKSFGTSTYTCWYYTQFYGNYLFHSILYAPGSMTKVVESGLGTSASHGCVRLSLSHAKWIYNNIPTNTKVISY
ncbi:MAG: L,D-transpeptidase family protein [Lachnospiraceae bacterium]|nr:L,D-transpeptidase family protein [Lachnospiraceae bacterium]